MFKAACLVLGLSGFSAALGADSTDACAGAEGSALSRCRADLQALRQEQLEQQLRRQEERQNQLDKQQRDVQQQLESMRLENENLRKQLERETAAAAASRDARPMAAGSSDSPRNPDLKAWRADNPWFGSDYARTQFAMRYLKQLQQERPELTGRDLLDALSAKVDDTFGAGHRAMR